MTYPIRKEYHSEWISYMRCFSVYMSSIVCGTWYHRLSGKHLYRKHLTVPPRTYPRQSFTGITDTTDDWRCHVQTQKNTLIEPGSLSGW